MSRVIDRRSNGRNKSAVNRQRFIDRFKKQIKKSVEELASKRNITEIGKSESITISSDDTSEPVIGHGIGGIREIVLPGNKNFNKGDLIRRPKKKSMNSNDSNVSDTGSGEDDFVFKLSKEEFLEIFFEDLALPNLVKKEIFSTSSVKKVRAGFAKTGIPANINIIKSMKMAIGRKKSINKMQQNKINNKQKEIDELLKSGSGTKDTIEILKSQISKIKFRNKKIPFIDPIDIRYNNKVEKVLPNTQAVVFCIMDVSGSMDEDKKYIAKRFFILLYLFLKKNYEKIDLVFIRHHTSAKEVSEQDFFYSRETGGTVVSSALELMNEIMIARYPISKWNIYGAQVSDGDNWNNDSPNCKKLLLNNIMQYVQYFSYIEVMPRNHQSLWDAYIDVKKEYNNFAMQSIANLSDIYPVFHELFKKHNDRSSL